jgi:hypothetical protein
MATNPLNKIWSATMAGLKAFKENYIGTDEENSFIEYDARALRYRLLWAMYENSAYRRMHKWSSKYKADFGLYEYIRGVYNPSYRLAEFWRAHLLGGKLDPNAGDGMQYPSTLPIVTDNDALRVALAALWKASNFQIKKDVLALWTTVMGDGVIKIVDDTARKKVFLSMVHPATIKSLDLDNFGNVKGYIIEERRPDPRKDGANRTVKYTEIATREGQAVVYATFLDDRPYSWDGDGLSKWSESYGFIPMVTVQHSNVGSDFGWAEAYPGLAKFREADDLASKLSDQVRKMVDSDWLFAGVKAGNVSFEKPEVDEYQPERGRENINALYGPVGATATPLVAPLDIAAAAAYIKDILADIERDYPELNSDMHNVQGDISGRALRINRAPAEDKVLERRPNYDDALVRAFQMAISIGGFRGYEGYEGFDLNSYAAGDMEMTIGDRPVFRSDPLDKTDVDTAFYAAGNAAKTFGIPPLVYLKRSGWTDDEIKMVEKSKEYEARMAAMDAATQAVQDGYQPVTAPGRTSNPATPQVDTAQNDATSQADNTQSA